MSIRYTFVLMLGMNIFLSNVEAVQPQAFVSQQSSVASGALFMTALVGSCVATRWSFARREKLKSTKSCFEEYKRDLATSLWCHSLLCSVALYVHAVGSLCVERKFPDKSMVPVLVCSALFTASALCLSMAYGALQGWEYIMKNHGSSGAS
jgi:uncharacterized membrane protein